MPKKNHFSSSRSARQSPTSHQPFIGELQHQNSDLQRDLANLKKELDLTNQKLGSSMHSIKTFWSPELKKERALRKEESAKYSLINDQLKLLSSENQVSGTLWGTRKGYVFSWLPKLSGKPLQSVKVAGNVSLNVSETNFNVFLVLNYGITNFWYLLVCVGTPTLPPRFLELYYTTSPPMTGTL